jgi:hypothetical protein
MLALTCIQKARHLDIDKIVYFAHSWQQWKPKYKQILMIEQLALKPSRMHLWWNPASIQKIIIEYILIIRSSPDMRVCVFCN